MNRNLQGSQRLDTPDAGTRMKRRVEWRPGQVVSSRMDSECGRQSASPGPRLRKARSINEFNLRFALVPFLRCRISLQLVVTRTSQVIHVLTEKTDCPILLFPEFTRAFKSPHIRACLFARQFSRIYVKVFLRWFIRQIFF